MKLDDSHPGKPGRSILEQIWEELDATMDRLRSDGVPDPDPAMSVGAAINAGKDWGEERGRAQGVAFAIAVMTNPYAPDVPKIKAEARKRWERRNHEGEGKETKASPRKRR